MRNDQENDSVCSLLQTESHSAKGGPGRYFVDTSIKLGTQTDHFFISATLRNHICACAMAT